MSLDVSRESSGTLSGLFVDCCMVDVWRTLHPNSSCFTWFKRDGTLASRVDYFDRPYVWIPFVSSADILPCPFSDHCFLSLAVSIPSDLSNKTIFLKFGAFRPPDNYTNLLPLWPIAGIRVE